MNDRILQWVGAGMLTAGLSCVMLVGAGIAIAEPDSGTGTGQSTSSQSTESTDSAASQAGSQDNDVSSVEAEPDEDVTEDVTDEDVVDEEEVTEEEGVTEEEDVTEDEVVTDEVEAIVAEDVAEDDASDHDVTTDIDTEPTREPAAAVTNEVDEVDEVQQPEPTQEADEPAEPTAAPATVEREPSSHTMALTDTEPATAQVVVSTTAVDEQARPTSPLIKVINVIGTIAWSVLDFFTKLVDLPPALPANSSVTVGRSRLAIDCGDGYTADADWYYPKEGQPEKLIYFQHGFMARASFYDRTLTELAERNNAIVVAPSITSNYFACDGCSLTADPMHAAVARLFEDDRDALLASARAAGFEGTLPEQFVFSGQSAGSMLAAGASGYYYASAPAEQKADLVGVLLFDGSAANGALARALDKLPSSVPVLQVAAAPAVLNNGGGANKVLLQKRPGQFNGVQLIGGAHSDAFQSSAFFGLVQGFVSLAFGASSPENVEAVQVLSQGWLTDMYAGRVYDPATRTGIYGDPGQPGQTVIDIPTDAGLASGYVLPGPPASLSPIERFFAGLLHSINSNDFITCSTEPSAAGSCPGSIAV